MDFAALSQLFTHYFHHSPNKILALPQAGSDRKYYRVSNQNHAAIGTKSEDVKENKTFIQLARHFKSKGICVPEVYGVSEDGRYYLQEDLGSVALYDLVKGQEFTQELESLYQSTLTELLKLQIDGAEQFDFTICYPVQILIEQVCSGI